MYVDEAEEGLVEQFKMSVIGQVIQHVAVTSNHPGVYDDMLSAYLNDFVYMTYPCANTKEHGVCIYINYY